MYKIHLDIEDAATGESRRIADIPILKSLGREARVKALSEAFARLFDVIEAGPVRKELPTP